MPSKSLVTLTNTLTTVKTPLSPLYDRQILLYVCGITPYDFAHLGHARVYILFDLLYRLLTFLDYKVIYCRNFTDIDDKLIERARVTYNDPQAYGRVAQQFIDAFGQDMAALGCLKPTYEPKVTEHIAHIIAFIQGLIDKGAAYQIDGDVYFDVMKDSDYGKLSKQRLDELQAGARVEVNREKRSPLDFALWKAEDEGTFWQSPWGWGRPGWHIECSALAKEYLGPHIDIHGGGADLIFPHHENEIAQSESLTGKPLANIWLHNAFVQINKEKMSKSLGNFFTLRQLFEKTSPMVIRFLMLNHHYRSPIDFVPEELPSIQRAYQRLCALFSQRECAENLSSEEMKKSSTVQTMLAFLCDDLNTVGALGVVFKNAKLLAHDKHELCATKQFLQTIFGLDLVPLPIAEVTITLEIQALIDEREKARQTKDWKRADELRQQLINLGVAVQDKKA